MRKLLGFATIALLAAPVLGGQQQWQSEIGIQGGFVRVKPAGTSRNDHFDLFDVPGFALASTRPGYASLFVVIPWRRRLAVEPSFAVSQVQQTLNTTFADLGLRLDYAFTPKFYAAAGATLAAVSGSVKETQLGVLVAAGYRMHLTGTLRGRVEARVNLQGNSDRYRPRDSYAVLFGLSAVTGDGAGSGGTPRRAAPPKSAWRQAIGVAGGYSQMHGVRSGSTLDNLTVLAFPGFGSGLAASLTQQQALPPTLFAILPLGAKIALEPGFDLHRGQQAGPGNLTVASANFSARLDYAIHGGWYAAAGGNAHYVKFTGTPAYARPGATLAAGYRFDLGGSLRGRLELSEIMFAARNTQPRVRAINVTSLTIGLMVPLK
jgi:hypothetical protein